MASRRPATRFNTQSDANAEPGPMVPHGIIAGANSISYQQILLSTNPTKWRPATPKVPTGNFRPIWYPIAVMSRGFVDTGLADRHDGIGG